MPHDVQTSYDRVADEYVTRIYDELRHKPLDRDLLDRFATSVRDMGLVYDVGCGPGHIASYLNERGVHVCGMDLSGEMILRASRLNPGVEFTQGDMFRLEAADDACAGIVAFYSIIHIPRADVVRALRELRRVLWPNGLLLISFHVGDQTIHLDDWWGHSVCVDFYFFRSDEMTDYLTTAGYRIEEVIEREPYPEVEHQSRRAYIFARKATCVSGSAQDCGRRWRFDTICGTRGSGGCLASNRGRSKNARNSSSRPQLGPAPSGGCATYRATRFAGRT